MKTEYSVGETIKIPMRIEKIEVRGSKPEHIDYIMVLDVFPQQRITVSEAFIFENNLNAKD